MLDSGFAAEVVMMSRRALRVPACRRMAQISRVGVPHPLQLYRKGWDSWTINMEFHPTQLGVPHPLQPHRKGWDSINSYRAQRPETILRFERPPLHHLQLLPSIAAAG